MREVARQFHLGQLPQNIARDPRIEKGTAAVRFETGYNAKIVADSHRPAKKINALLQAPGITPCNDSQEKRLTFQRGFGLSKQRIEVV
jgi:hypothetical protein